MRLEKLFGITKKTFLEKNVVRASDDDKFNDNKCIFCTCFTLTRCGM
jgi:hypothetical protein